MRAEDTIVSQLAVYLNMQYPSIIYHFDVGSGGVKSIGMAMRDKRINRWRGYPDLFIARSTNKGLGLFIEVKKDGTKIYNKNKSNFATPHLKEQAELLEKLTGEGYKAVFGIGFDHCKQIIDDFLAL